VVSSTQITVTLAISAAASTGGYTVNVVTGGGTSNGLTFTVATAPPVISAVSASGITASRAVITWTTDKPSDTQVAYGTTAAYGSLSPLVSTLVTSHSVTLTGLSASTTYHYQAMSRDSQGNLATAGGFTFTTPAAPAALLQIQADASEVSGTTNGSTVTPAVAPAGFTGTVVVKGGGSVNYAAASNGNGVFFLNCCGNTSNAYYKFVGATVGNVFNVGQGQINFSLKSRYSFTQRRTTAATGRYVFDVRDGSGVHLFNFQTQVASGYLQFTYVVAGSSQYYFVPVGTEDALFGAGVTLNVTLAWNGSTVTLSLNGTPVKTTNYTPPAPNWSPASLFNLGAYEYLSYGGYSSCDDIIDEFTILP
jgi:hypothetical protein